MLELEIGAEVKVKFRIGSMTVPGSLTRYWDNKYHFLPLNPKLPTPSQIFNFTAEEIVSKGKKYWKLTNTKEKSRVRRSRGIIFV